MEFGCFTTKEQKNIFPLFVGLFIWGLVAPNIVRGPAAMGSVAQREELPNAKSAHRGTQQRLRCCYS